MTHWVFLIVFLFSRIAAAHHSFSIEFDAKAPVQLDGVVTSVELINPHSYIHIAVHKVGAPDQKWMIECGTPNTLYRAGLDKNSLKVGTKVHVRGYQSRDRSCRPACKANGRNITLPNGKTIFTGSSGTGAPRDGADKSEPAN